MRALPLPPRVAPSGDLWSIYQDQDSRRSLGAKLAVDSDTVYLMLPTLLELSVIKGRLRQQQQETGLPIT